MIAAFRDAGFTDVIIAARNRESGPALAKQYGFQWQPQPEGIACDILVNVTPVGMSGGKESHELAFSEAMVSTASVVLMSWPCRRKRRSFAGATAISRRLAVRR